MIREGFIPPQTREEKLDEILSNKPLVGEHCKCLECALYNDEDTSAKHTCRVYGGGIPRDIISGKIQHDHSLGDDYGLTFSQFVQPTLPEY